MTRPKLLLILLSLAGVLALGCSPASLFGNSEIGRYVEAIRDPVARSSEWAQDVAAFYQEAAATRNLETACADEALPELILRGDAIIAELSAIDPPGVISVPHEGVIKGGGEITENLRKIQGLACENHDLEAAKETIAETAEKIGGLTEMLDTLKAWLKDR